MITRRRFLGYAALAGVSVALGSLPSVGKAIIGIPKQMPSNLPMPPNQTPFREASLVTYVLEPGERFTAHRALTVDPFGAKLGLPVYLVSGDTLTNSGKEPLLVQWLESG